MRSVKRGHHKASHFRIEKTFCSRLSLAVKKLVAIDDLKHAISLAPIRNRFGSPTLRAKSCREAVPE